MDLVARRLCGRSVQLIKPGLFQLVSKNSSATPVVELREYKLLVNDVAKYMKVTGERIGLRKSLVPLRLFTMPDTGGLLNRATHFYYYEGGMPDRDQKRDAQGKNKEWQAYLSESRPCVLEQSSLLFNEAKLDCAPDATLASASGVRGGNELGADPTYEIRRYQLKLGYDAVPTFLSHFERGLPSKLANKHETTDLCSVLYTECGSLNEVIEVWRHGDGAQAMVDSRVRARVASEWRSAIGAIAEISTSFTSGIHRPVEFSAWK